jgi:hypothetical protein
MRFFISCCLFLTCLWPTEGYGQGGPASHTFAAQSVLSTGSWYKIGVTGSGLYKLDKSMLQAMGLPVEQLDPRHLQVYGNGGGMLPQVNSAPRPDDLRENAVFIAGETDGRFDAADYVLFYAPGPHRWQYNAIPGLFSHAYNVYADTAYYFITVGTQPGRRIVSQAAAGRPGDTIATFADRQFLEQDLVNVLKSGRTWFGEAFNTLTLSRNYNFPLPDVVPGSTVHLTTALMGDSEAASSFQVAANGHLLGSPAFSGRGSQNYHAAGQADTRTLALGAQLLAGNTLEINLTYNPQGFPAATGYLDYLEVNAARSLKLTDSQTTFRSTRFLGTGRAVTFQIAGAAAGTLVWEVSKPHQPQAMHMTYARGHAYFNALTDTLREYVAFTGTDFPGPVAVGKVANQNLHGLNLDGGLDLVILTHPLFKAQAEALAQHRRQRDRLQVEVVTTGQVYQEFSSGAQDVTAIRDFMKMLYDRRRGGDDQPLYLLLFGDASYDYKSRITPNTNFVPVYESRESLDPLNTYSSEDYYGFLNEEEGWWSETSFSAPELLDIGIGRLPVKTVSEAEAMVRKIRHYDSPAGFGKWRNRITLLADDGDGAEHLRDAESLAQYLETSQPAYLAKKLYLDLYPQQALPSGQRSPAAAAALNQAIDQGTLLLNYTGHGNETVLAHEQVLTLPQIEAWRNYDRLVFMLTATCEFGRYDDPSRSSGAEIALLSPQGGAIGLLTTTRPVFASTNRLLNRNFTQMAFSPVNGRMPRLGELLIKTKNNSQAQANNRNFTLLGDPSQQLAYPSLQAHVTAIDAVPLAAGIADTLRALQHVTLSGSITDGAQAVQAGFQGLIEVTIFDKPTTVKTLGDETAENNPVVQDIQVQENILYAGTASVLNGNWQITFVVPKDISYPIGPGRISLYAYNAHTDAHGLAANLPIGGSLPQAQEDNTPPQIRLFMDDESFVSGGLTDQHPVLLARLFDANGINTTGIGIGHDLTATLDGDKTNTMVLNDYYTADRDNFQSGLVRFPLQNLAVGWHEISFKAWDTHNNAAEARIRFQVTNGRKIIMNGTKAFPNPFTDHTTFQFDHNRVNEALDIQIHIFTVTGRIVKRINTSRPANDMQLPRVSWDGRDEAGKPVSAGIYLYRITLRSTSDGKQIQNFNRLIKLN